MWKALREIAKNTTFYYKQLNLFLVLLLLLGAGLVLRNPQFRVLEAATDLPEALAPAPTSNDAKYEITVSSSAAVSINGQTVRGAVQHEGTQSRMLIILVRDSAMYLDSLSARVQLPRTTTATELNPRIYAIHGVGPSFTRLADSRTIQFEAQEVFEGATVSIELTFPQGYFDITPLERFRSKLVTLPPEAWLTVGIILPSATGLFLLLLLLRRLSAYTEIQTKQILNKPPLTQPPAVIGALYHGKIGRREITATLFDLAVRGFVRIHLGGQGEVVFGKGSNLFTAKANTLKAYEVFLLHQIFGDANFASRSGDIEKSLNKELFSSKVAMTILNIYDATVAEGYFVRSPNSYYLKYKATGITMFFIGLVALLYGAFALPEPAFVLFLWAGMVAASLLIVALTPGLPTRTKVGTQTLSQWMGFRNYLKDTHPIKPQMDTDEFFAYLPYAIVLDAEREWMQRWRKEALILPEWFSAEQVPYTAEDYAHSILSVVNFLSGHLVTSRPPNLA